MYFFVEKKKSEKTGKEYFVLGADLEYKIQTITYDVAIICAVLDLTERQLHEKLELDRPVYVAKIYDCIDFVGE